MTSLHTLAHRDASKVLPYVAADDALLLIEDGCYLLLEADLFTALPTSVTLYILKDDLYARGLENQALHRDAQRIDYSQFVELCCENDKVINWFDS